MIEVVISPSVTMWTISQRACGSHWCTRTTTTSASIQPITGRAARRCQAPRPVAGERLEGRGSGAGEDGSEDDGPGADGTGEDGTVQDHLRRDPGPGGRRPVGDGQGPFQARTGRGRSVRPWSRRHGT